MDHSFDDNVRAPDEIIREQLLGGTDTNTNDYDAELDKAIYLSYEDIREQQEYSRKMEQKLIEDYKRETDKRTKVFEKFLPELHKLSIYDKEIREIYQIIGPIIDNYCQQFIDTCKLDEITYKKIFDLLSKVRIDKVAVNHLKTVIFSE